MNYTKLMEAGKKQRKNWVQQWVVLLANNLLFYKDQKQATMVKILPFLKKYFVSLLTPFQLNVNNNASTFIRWNQSLFGVKLRPGDLKF